MTFPQIYVIVVLVIPLTLVFLNRLREDVAALLMAVLLGAAQYLGMGVLGPANAPDDAAKALNGFGTPEVITLMALFILTASLDKYGATRWLAGRLLAVGGRSERRLITLFAVTAAMLSLFMNTLAAGALLLPSALDASRRTGIKPSKLLIPIAYGTMLGGAATYLTTANIVVSALLPLANPPQPPLGIFDFTPTGGLVAIAGLIFLALFGRSLLPDREPPSVQVGPTSAELTKTYQLHERLWEAEVMPGSGVANQSLGETRIGESLGMAVLGVRRGNRVLAASAADERILVGDVLIIVGREERAKQLEQAGLRVTRPVQDQDAALEARDVVFVEVIVPPRSGVEGKTLRDLSFRDRYGFTAVALWRDNRSYRTDVAAFALQPGDTLLLMGPQERLGALKGQQDIVVLGAAATGDGLDGPRVALTVGIAVASLAAMFIGAPVELAMIAGAAAILVAGLMSPEEAYTAVKWRAIFLIAGTISVSLAMVETGLATLIGDSVVGAVSSLGPMGLVAGTYLLSAALTQVMGGQISPLVVGPITIAAAIRLGVNPQAIAVVTAIAGSISFITPLSHPVNILMIAPANYTFGDFVKSGWALTVVCFIALMIAVPLFWRL
ncbi:MAG: SLC13 family permease [Anaerolineae bacterium]|nr:SLC13 family permease [Anaerolineae bacterium]